MPSQPDPQMSKQAKSASPWWIQGGKGGVLDIQMEKRARGNKVTILKNCYGDVKQLSLLLRHQFPPLTDNPDVLICDSDGAPTGSPDKDSPHSLVLPGDCRVSLEHWLFENYDSSKVLEEKTALRGIRKMSNLAAQALAGMTGKNEQQGGTNSAGASKSQAGGSSSSTSGTTANTNQMKTTVGADGVPLLVQTTTAPGTNRDFLDALKGIRKQVPYDHPMETAPCWVWHGWWPYCTGNCQQTEDKDLFFCLEADPGYNGKGGEDVELRGPPGARSRSTGGQEDAVGVEIDSARSRGTSTSGTVSPAGRQITTARRFDTAEAGAIFRELGLVSELNQKAIEEYREEMKAFRAGKRGGNTSNKAASSASPRGGHGQQLPPQSEAEKRDRERREQYLQKLLLDRQKRLQKVEEKHVCDICGHVFGLRKTLRVHRARAHEWAPELVDEKSKRAKRNGAQAAAPLVPQHRLLQQGLAKGFQPLQVPSLSPNGGFSTNNKGGDTSSANSTSSTLMNWANGLSFGGGFGAASSSSSASATPAGGAATGTTMLGGGVPMSDVRSRKLQQQAMLNEPQAIDVDDWPTSEDDAGGTGNNKAARPGPHTIGLHHIIQKKTKATKASRAKQKVLATKSVRADKTLFRPEDRGRTGAGKRGAFVSDPQTTENKFNASIHSSAAVFRIQLDGIEDLYVDHTGNPLPQDSVAVQEALHEVALSRKQIPIFGSTGVHCPNEKTNLVEEDYEQLPEHSTTESDTDGSDAEFRKVLELSMKEDAERRRMEEQRREEEDLQLAIALSKNVNHGEITEVETSNTQGPSGVKSKSAPLASGSSRARTDHDRHKSAGGGLHEPQSDLALDPEEEIPLEVILASLEDEAAAKRNQDQFLNLAEMLHGASDETVDLVIRLLEEEEDGEDSDG
ncbi:unnamed protein product [Amoebophrya sp. A120]|nr:unnamed protein product [Amoebophrya sp. A120]|eukprot:GSA120T00007829001.1